MMMMTTEKTAAKPTAITNGGTRQHSAFALIASPPLPLLPLPHRSNRTSPSWKTSGWPRWPPPSAPSPTYCTALWGSS